jgi:hypothetical protein
MGCLTLYGLNSKGYCCTGLGTLKLGKSRDGWESIIPREIIERNIIKRRERLSLNRARDHRCQNAWS